MRFQPNFQKKSGLQKDTISDIKQILLNTFFPKLRFKPQFKGLPLSAPPARARFFNVGPDLDKFIVSNLNDRYVHRNQSVELIILMHQTKILNDPKKLLITFRKSMGFIPKFRSRHFLLTMCYKRKRQIPLSQNYCYHKISEWQGF